WGGGGGGGESWRGRWGGNVALGGGRRRAERKALARGKPAAALDGHRTPGSGETLSAHQGLSRNAVAEGTSEPVRHSAEGGQKSGSRLNLVAERLTVPNIESRCNQLKLGHPHCRVCAGLTGG